MAGKSFRRKKTILHIFNDKFILDQKNIENLPIGLFGNFYYHELCFFLFNTNDYSFHGHPDPLDCPENIDRRSIALYYYSNGRPKSEINPNMRFHNTLYKNRQNSKDDIDERMPEFKKLFGKLYIRKKVKI